MSAAALAVAESAVSPYAFATDCQPTALDLAEFKAEVARFGPYRPPKTSDTVPVDKFVELIFRGTAGWDEPVPCIPFSKVAERLTATGECGEWDAKRVKRTLGLAEATDRHGRRSRRQSLTIPTATRMAKAFELQGSFAELGL